MANMLTLILVKISRVYNRDNYNLVLLFFFFAAFLHYIPFLRPPATAAHFPHQRVTGSTLPTIPSLFSFSPENEQVLKRSALDGFDQPGYCFYVSPYTSPFLPPSFPPSLSPFLSPP